MAKGYFKDAKLDVQVDAGTGSGAAVQRVASGTYDMGFADMAALMEFHANNPDAPNKPVGVMMVYNNTPAAVMVLKKSGIKTVADLNGKKLGAPVFDAGRRGFPIFQKANNISGVTWVSMDPPLRETMLARGDVDAITGFSFTSLLNLEARGVKAEDVVTCHVPELRREAVWQRDHRLAQADPREPGRRQGLPRRLLQGREGSDGQSRRGDRLHQAARRHHQHRPGEAPPAHGDQRRHRQPRRPRRRLRPGQSRAACR